MTKRGFRLLGFALLLALPTFHGGVHAGHLTSALSPAPAVQQTAIALVDDFVPQPRRGELVWPYNRVGGDRGPIEPTEPGQRVVEWRAGSVKATILNGTNTFVGVFTSLNHPIRENKSLNFSSIFPPQVMGQFQGRIVGIRVQISAGQGTFQAELQAPDGNFPWRESVQLSSSAGPRLLSFALPPLGDIRNLNWIIKGSAGDFVIVERVEIVLELPQLGTSERQFLWSYSMLLANFDSPTGMTRDRASDAVGDVDNVSASGAQAAAAAMAWHLGFISKSSASAIIESTTAGLLRLPRCHGVWPHFLTHGQIASGSEWSSVDTIIAIVALLEAREAVGLDKADTAKVEQVLKDIEWAELALPDGSVSHGYDHGCTQRLVSGWRDFGTESWLANLGYAAATGNVAALDSEPPTFNGSGFIDELAWLFSPAPSRDRFGIEWSGYRPQATGRQLDYYLHHPCYKSPGLFGLSAAEVPDPSSVPVSQIYQAFGVGGKIPANDGTGLSEHAVITPHYAAMIASLRPTEASIFWQWLEMRGLSTPLNNVESFMFTDEPICQDVVWNALKGSWNLTLQTLGWGRLLAMGNNPLYGGMCANVALARGAATMWGLAESSCRPELIVKVNQTSFHPGDTLRIGLTARSIGAAFNTDFYLGILLPDRVTACFIANLSPLQGTCIPLIEPLRPQEFPRLAGDILLPEGLDIMLSDVLSFTLSDGEPQGDYLAFALLIRAGAFSDDTIDPGDILAIGSKSFAVSR